jgi:aspartate aminotransferase
MTQSGPSPAWLDARIRGATPAPTLAISELSQALVRGGRDIYRLGLGQSPFPVPPSVVEALRAHAHEKDYLPVRGLPALREAVARHVKRHTGMEYDPAQIIVGPGSKQLLFLTQLVVDAELVLPSPSWVSYAPQARLAGRAVQWLPTRRSDRWHLDPDVLDAHCRSQGHRPRILLLNYPNNPNGATMSADRLAAIAQVARGNGVLVLSDEIYGLVDHEGTHTSIAAFYPEGTVITSGLSKWCGAGGWRLGTLLIPKELDWLADALAAAASETHTAVSAPIQHAAVTAFNGNAEIDEYLRHSRRVLRALGRHCARVLADAGLDLDEPDGGFYLFPDASPFAAALASRGICDSTAMCGRMLEEIDVATLPGTAFGRPPEELTFRLSYVDFDGGAALDASSRMPAGEALDAEFLARNCGRVLTAIDRVSTWVGDK